MVAQLVRIEIIAADAAAERGDQRADFGRRQHLVEARFFDVEDLSLQRQDRLGAPVAPLLGGTAGRIALDQEQLGQRRVLLLAIGELAGQAGDIERALAAGHLARLARGFPRPGGIDDLRDDGFRFLRLLEQEVLEPSGHCLLDNTFNFR